jgi:hypothetical protein
VQLALGKMLTFPGPTYEHLGPGPFKMLTTRALDSEHLARILHDSLKIRWAKRGRLSSRRLLTGIVAFR